MSDAKHTPGDWMADVTGRSKRWRVYARVLDGPSYVVAAVHNGAPGDTLDTEAANARLIAASPCLLAICVEMIDAIDGSHAQVMATAARMNRVIAKATGVQS